MHDRDAARLRAAEPGAGIAEIRPRKFAQPDDVGIEFFCRGQAFCLDRDMKQPVDGGKRQPGPGGLFDFGGGSHGVSPLFYSSGNPMFR